LNPGGQVGNGDSSQLGYELLGGGPGFYFGGRGGGIVGIDHKTCIY